MTWSSETRDDCDGHVVVQGGQHRGDEACPDECAGTGVASGGGLLGASSLSHSLTLRLSDSLTLSLSQSRALTHWPDSA